MLEIDEPKVHKLDAALLLYSNGGRLHYTKVNEMNASVTKVLLRRER